ncbi:MAG: biopolymer transporter ExbD [Alphaproteobacteria bacterium]
MRARMPSLHRRRPPGNGDERILPLINVVFLLLIFFMLAGRLAASDPFEVEPPASASDGPAADGELELLIGPDGELALDGMVIERKGLDEAIALRLAEAPAVKARIKADSGAAAVDVLDMLERLNAAGIEELLLVTRAGAS